MKTPRTNSSSFRTLDELTGTVSERRTRRHNRVVMAGLFVVGVAGLSVLGTHVMSSGAATTPAGSIASICATAGTGAVSSTGIANAGGNTGGCATSSHDAVALPTTPVNPAVANDVVNVVSSVQPVALSN